MKVRLAEHVPDRAVELVVDFVADGNALLGDEIIDEVLISRRGLALHLMSRPDNIPGCSTIMDWKPTYSGTHLERVYPYKAQSKPAEPKSSEKHDAPTVENTCIWVKHEPYLTRADILLWTMVIQFDLYREKKV